MNIKISLFFLFFVITAVQLQAMGPKAIHSAAEKGDLAALQQCIDQDPTSINRRDNCGLTPLQQSCLSFGDHHNAETVLFLLDHGALVNTHDKWGCTPLSCASRWGKAPVVRLLLKYGASINQQDNKGDTPLHCTVAPGACCDTAVVSLLLESGASVYLKDKIGMTPYDLVVNSHAIDSQTVADLLHKWRKVLKKYNAARLAVLEALHPRLGAGSPAKELPQLAVRDIFQFIRPIDFK